MKLEFILCEINKENRLWDIVKKNNELNEFIIVGEEKVGSESRYKVVQLVDDGIRLIGGLLLDELAYSIKKSDVSSKKDEFPGTLTVELDIPKEYLTIDIIEAVQRINS